MPFSGCACMARTGRAEARGVPVVYPRLSGTMSDIAGACLRGIDGAPSSEELWAEIYSASQSKGGSGDDVGGGYFVATPLCMLRYATSASTSWGVRSRFGLLIQSRAAYREGRCGTPRCISPPVPARAASCAYRHAFPLQVSWMLYPKL